MEYEKRQINENPLYKFPKQMELFVIVHPINVCKIVFPDHLLLPFLDKLQIILGCILNYLY